MARTRRLRMPMDSKKPLIAMGFGLFMLFLASVRFSKSELLGSSFKFTWVDADSILDFLFVVLARYGVAVLLLLSSSIYVRRKIKFIMLPILLYGVMCVYLYVFEPLMYGSWTFFGDLVPLVFAALTALLFYNGLYLPGRSGKPLQFACLAFGLLLLVLTLSYRGPFAEDSAYQGRTIFTSTLLYSLCYYFALAAIASGLSNDPGERYYSRARSAAIQQQQAKRQEEADPAPVLKPENIHLEEPAGEGVRKFRTSEHIELFDPEEQRRKRAAYRKQQLAEKKARRKKSRDGIDEI